MFIPFISPIDSVELPKEFNYPFYYKPHPICLIASKELQDYIKSINWNHNFGLIESQKGIVIGKMFGVLVVRNNNGKLGYIAAFSGKIGDLNIYEKFVPPVYDILDHNSFFLPKIEELNQINAKVKKLESDEYYSSLSTELKQYVITTDIDILEEKQRLIQNRKLRKEKKLNGISRLSNDDYLILEKKLLQESIHDRFYLKELSIYYKEQIDKKSSVVSPFEIEINKLKEKRKIFSNKLQHQIFDAYHFLNGNGNNKSLLDIFIKENEINPPAGSGECAAPKLLQYAYINNLEPISMAEFWWGSSPRSEIRKHKQFYPACSGKCKPILEHMLKGINVESNPLLENIGQDKSIEIVFEDDYLLVINKPEDLLSAPGKTIKDSVQTRMKQSYPNATGPLIVHRLDMSTSGLMIIAKSLIIYKAIQKQFLDRTIKKRYVAILDGVIDQNRGTIELPLRVDLDDRPRQLVCNEHGKYAKTFWNVISRSNRRTIIHFYPVTGRTHQLRVHAAHHLGLNAPIVGDDIYGTRDKRLCLHAESLQFIHPVSKEEIKIKKDAFFNL